LIPSACKSSNAGFGSIHLESDSFIARHMSKGLKWAAVAFEATSCLDSGVPTSEKKIDCCYLDNCKPPSHTEPWILAPATFDPLEGCNRELLNMSFPWLTNWKNNPTDDLPETLAHAALKSPLRSRRQYFLEPILRKSVIQLNGIEVLWPLPHQGKNRLLLPR